MGLLATCPLPAEISDIDVLDCEVQVGQIVKLVFQRLYSTGTTRNSWTIATTDPAELAGWTTLKAASDSTKATVTPLVQDPQLEAGEPITFGGGNATVDGVERIVGLNPAPFNTQLFNLKAIIEEQMKTYRNEANLAVYFVDEFGRIIGQTNDNTTPTIFYPVPIVTGSYVLGDRRMGRFDEPDSNALTFSLQAGWSEKMYIVTPTDFNARIDL